MRRFALALALALLVLGTQPASAASPAASIKFSCKTAGVAQLDPIVNPDGSASAHEHTFLGNTGLALGVHDYPTAITQTTTCQFTGDTAGYWRPTLFDPNGNRVAAKNVVYYDRMQAPITAFPPDLGQVFGSNLGLFSSKPRSYWGWNCDNTEPLQRSFQDLSCPGGSQVVTFRAFSPYCLDNVTPPTRNFTGHIIYPVNYPTNQLCPSGYTTLPRLRVNINFQVTSCHDCYLSSDALGQHGESAHTDFWNVWQQPALEGLVAQLNA